MNLTLMAHL